METFNEKKEKVIYNQSSTFVVGAGKFGGKRSSDKAKPVANPPSRSPDSSISEKTSIDQVCNHSVKASHVTDLSSRITDTRPYCHKTFYNHFCKANQNTASNI